MSASWSRSWRSGVLASAVLGCAVGEKVREDTLVTVQVGSQAG